MAERIFVPVTAEHLVGEGEVRRARIVVEVVCKRDLERLCEQGARLLVVAPAERHGSLAAKRLGDRLRIPVDLRDVESQLGALARALEIADEPVGDAEPGREQREVFVGRIRKKLGVDVIQTVRGLGYLLTLPDAR